MTDADNGARSPPNEMARQKHRLLPTSRGQQGLFEKLRLLLRWHRPGLLPNFPDTSNDTMCLTASMQRIRGLIKGEFKQEAVK